MILALTLLSAISYQLSAISYQLSAISYQLSAISYQLSAISYQLLAYGSDASFAQRGQRPKPVPPYCSRSTSSSAIGAFE
ncbi:MAG: hypothetical protein F6J98_20875 [Moorea sp. SIO4G2]|uniref:Uncharacterized protein n=1 Tax=Moorena bouillonii PNG TaxID=568701 RepID=A0A1U7N463_9CYAN|nr:hypothetical protein [Moorena sp. SIO4G2]OLT60711.1 hypothetical protein BJP37_18530 [Moorena bouillonii PNG]